MRLSYLAFLFPAAPGAFRTFWDFEFLFLSACHISHVAYHRNVSSYLRSVRVYMLRLWPDPSNTSNSHWRPLPIR
ncbi:hypothetical protein GGS20DRAFT_535648 [Poronia punctata]|nr:hypothetical protein GGS20DRAFT_535648 [Poronia punctata]